MAFSCQKLFQTWECTFNKIKLHTKILCQNIQGSSSNILHTLPPPLNGLQKGKYTPNTWLIQKQLFADILQNSSGTSFSTTFCVWYFTKMFLIIHSIDWPNFIVRLPYFWRYWAMCVLKQFVNQAVMS